MHCDDSRKEAEEPKMIPKTCQLNSKSEEETAAEIRASSGGKV